MNLDAYFERIDFHGTPTTDFETLATIQHQHLLTIPYENGDVQLRRPLDFDIQRIFDKLVTQKRGGWCYEMNGLLGWALSEIGFQVTRMSGAVDRAKRGDSSLGNHLVLEVKLDKPYLVDVGLGDGLRWPIAIEPGSHTQGGLDFRLEQMPDGFWRLHNHPFSNVASFDFKHERASEEELTTKCQWLQENPESPFRMAFICQRFKDDRIECQVGKIHTTITSEAKQSRVLDSLDELHENLRNNFNLDLDLTAVWQDIEAAHEKYFGEGS